MSGSSLRCSCCNKAHHAVRKLIAGPNVCICDECISVCVDIIYDDPYVRIGGERVVPPLRLDSQAEWRSHSRCTHLGFRVAIEAVRYDFQRGGNQMMRIQRSA